MFPGYPRIRINFQPEQSVSKVLAKCYLGHFAKGSIVMLAVVTLPVDPHIGTIL
jgi:hypothetical protein